MTQLKWIVIKKPKQSVKTAGPAIESGYDGGKNVSGRKRHILVDTLGLLLTVFVHDAHRDHIAGFQLLCSWVEGLFPRLQLMQGGWYISAEIA